MRSMFEVSDTLPQVELALKEGSIPYKYYSVNLYSKPAFFEEQINPTGKVCGDSRGTA